MTIALCLSIYLIIGLLDMQLRHEGFQSSVSGRGEKLILTGFTLGCAALWPLRFLASAWRAI